ISGTTWMSIAGLALFSTALAYIIYFKLLSSAGAVNVMLVTLLIPVSALLLGTFLLNEPVRPLEIIGMTIIGAALIIIDGRLLKLKKN
ncbi:MAG: DMT family transporter, partial [Woeseia sp.]|nr:DMT family transporter [Woeseia sp.]